MARVYRKPTTRSGVIHSIQEAGEQRAADMAAYILSRIKVYAPVDKKRRPSRKGRRRLKASYYFTKNAAGDQVLYSRVRYWKYMEYGTKKHGKGKRHIGRAFEDAAMRYRL